MANFYEKRTPKHTKKMTQSSVTRKKSPNVYESWPKMISLENLKILTPFTIIA